jgi:hypothetical protein
MMRAIDDYFLQKAEPNKSCLLALRAYMLGFHTDITEEWKYSMPMYYLRGKMFCYLWVHKKYKQPYLGIVEGRRINHPKLLQEKRARMKIMLFDPEKDLPIKTISAILKEAMNFYK